MGNIYGRREGNCLYIFDAIALPVEGTETRVNAGDAAHEYTSNLMELFDLVMI